MVAVAIICYAVALVCFALAAGNASTRLNMIGLGLAACALNWFLQVLVPATQ